MPSPSVSLSTLRPDLATFFEYDLAMEQSGYIATRVLPVAEAPSAAGPFGLIPLEQLLRETETLRGTGGYNRDQFTFKEDSFVTQEHGAEEVIDEKLRAQYREFFDAEMVATMRAYSRVLRNAEKRVADAVFNATTWTGSALTTAVTKEWDDFDDATPIADVEAAVTKVYENSGLWPNALVINYQVFRNLRNCEEVIDRLQSSGAGDRTTLRDVTTAQLAAVFDLPNIIVANVSRNGSKEGKAATPQQIWSGEYAMVCRVSESADMSDPCLGRTLHWSEDGSVIGGAIESYRDEAVRGDIIRVRHQTAEKILYKEAGHLLSNITS
jgi:hypothetical protein